MEGNAIEEIKRFEEHRSLVSVAYAQADFLRRYAPMIEERHRVDFEREFAYLLHLIYREAQQPLVKQLTDFVMEHNRPMIIERIERNKP